MLADVVQHLGLGVGQGGAPGQLVEQARGGVHLPHHLGHGLQGRVRRADHDVHPFTEYVQLRVGDQRGHLDECVFRQREPGHLAVDPHHAIVHGPTLRGAPLTGQGRAPGRVRVGDGFPLLRRDRRRPSAP